MLFIKRVEVISFLKELAKEYDVAAPCEKNGVVVFDKLGSQVELDKQTFFSAKKYFLPQCEKLFEFDNNSISANIKHKKRAIFGLRACDFNGLLVWDKLFLKEYVDPYYKKRRENTIIIGLSCEQPFKNCFCDSMNLKFSGFDLYFFRAKHGYGVVVGSKKGAGLISRRFFTQEDIKINNHFLPDCNKHLAGKDLSKHFNSRVWKKYSKDCLSCASCTEVCPTCSCFDITDEVESGNLRKGFRKRCWDSCQLIDFTKVAGNYVFRKERELRFKQRIYHHLKYYKDDYGVNLCVGCGRCATACPTNVADIPKMVSEL